MKAKVGFWVVGSLGVCGLIASLVWTFTGKGSFLAVILSMLLVLAAIQGIENKEP